MTSIFPATIRCALLCVDTYILYCILLSLTKSSRSWYIFSPSLYTVENTNGVPYSVTATSTTYNPNNYDKNSKMAGVTYAGKNQQIKQVKTKVIELPKKTITKTINYGPVNYYGKQNKTVVKKVTKK